jgi:TM2 domain
MRNKSTAYLLWLLGLVGICGVQRFYCNKFASGVIYLCTLGLFGFGQLLDLALIPGMVDEENLKYMILRGGSNHQSNAQSVVVNINSDQIQQKNSPITTNDDD